MENASAILCINAGSSSLKFAVYRMGGGAGSAEVRLFSGEVERIGLGDGRLWLRDDQGRTLLDRAGQFPAHPDAGAAMFDAVAAQGAVNFVAAGHRVVHGGPFFTAPEKVNDQVRRKLEQLIPFAPLHLPSQIAMIQAVSARDPDLGQVVCFDTAFHRGLPEVARHFALPRELADQGVLRYGFHGLSYEFVAGKLGKNKELGHRAVIAHLGNGASMVALKDGSPVDTSMGLTPTGGFMMGTRSGDLDPGVLLYLLRRGMTAGQMETLLDRQSGLLGVSGLTSDMRTLLEQGKTNPQAAKAVEMFCYQVRKFVGAFAAVLGGLDTLVFTGGIGERGAQVRAAICCGLEHLGVLLDAEKNARHAQVISAGNSKCTVRVVETDEDLMIARHTLRLVEPHRNPARD
jgi:acetate kinase